MTFTKYLGDILHQKIIKYELEEEGNLIMW